MRYFKMHPLSKALHDGQASLLIVANNVNFDANFVCCLKINILWLYSGMSDFMDYKGSIIFQILYPTV